MKRAHKVMKRAHKYMKRAHKYMKRAHKIMKRAHKIMKRAHRIVRKLYFLREIPNKRCGLIYQLLRANDFKNVLTRRMCKKRLH